MNLLLKTSFAHNTRYDHLVAIERSGRAADGNYYNMRGVNIKSLVDPIDDLFVAAANIPGISTTGSWRDSMLLTPSSPVESFTGIPSPTLEAAGCSFFYGDLNCPCDWTLIKFMCSSASAGVGDGGNELGMGKVKDKVKAKMPKGELIACDVAADFAITAGRKLLKNRLSNCLDVVFFFFLLK